MGDTLNMSVSQVFSREGKKYAYVSFTDGCRSAEGKIPDCRITSSSGFTSVELTQLEAYMRTELATLKRMASGVNVIDAFMKK